EIQPEGHDGSADQDKDERGNEAIGDQDAAQARQPSGDGCHRIIPFYWTKASTAAGGFLPSYGGRAAAPQEEPGAGKGNMAGGDPGGRSRPRGRRQRPHRGSPGRRSAGGFRRRT